MAKTDNQKLSILYIWDHLERESDQTHPVGAEALIEMLDKHNIKCERKTVYHHIATLQDYGVDIETRRGKKGGYYIATRNFELPELKLLIDAVQSSRFLTEKKSRELIEKLCRECNRYDASLMHRDLVIDRRVKNMNESIYYNVDAIQEAMNRNRKIRFRYFDWGIDGERHYRDKEYIASPYGLCQNNENYYLLAHSERHDVTNYRVDRMSSIELLDEPRVSCPELMGKNLIDYANRQFQMYKGPSERVKLRFHNSLVNVVVDRFGRDTMMIPDGQDHFTFLVDVAVSPLFLSWVIGFGEKARILHPQNVAEQCRELCRQVMEQYL